MSSPTRRLVVMRHAEAESVAASDRDRSLTARGRTDAAEAGRWLVSQGFVPDHALVSNAVRTRETWAAMAQAAGWELHADLEPALYHAGAESALDLVRMVPAGTGDLLLLGHNPTVGHLAQMLHDGQGDPAATTLMAHGHPTAGLALLEVDEEWSQLGWGDGHLAAFHVSRG